MFFRTARVPRAQGLSKHDGYMRHFRDCNQVSSGALRRVMSGPEARGPEEHEKERVMVEETTTTDPAAAPVAEGTLLATHVAPEQPEQPAQADAPVEAAAPAETESARPTYGEFKLPDGLTADAEAMKAATDLFADSKLSQEQAQKFIDFAASREKATAQAGVRAFVDLQTRWVSEIKADPEIGGSRLQASIASAARAIDRLDVPGLREALDLTGAGNNPAIVKAFARLGQMISEDRFRPGNGAPPNTPRSPAEVIYGAGGPKRSDDA